jgi:hypothetical protein
MKRNPTTRKLIGIIVQLFVLAVDLYLLVQMFDKGGWWIAGCLAWLVFVNWPVVAYFGDGHKSRGDHSVLFID